MSALSVGGESGRRHAMILPSFITENLIPLPKAPYIF